MRSRFWGFINQIHLIIRLQPHQCADGLQQVGFVGTLLSGPTQVWFVPLVETSSPLLEDFPAFLAELKDTFGDIDRCREEFRPRVETERKGRMDGVQRVHLFRGDCI